MIVSFQLKCCLWHGIVLALIIACWMSGIVVLLEDLQFEIVRVPWTAWSLLDFSIRCLSQCSVLFRQHGDLGKCL